MKSVQKGTSHLCVCVYVCTENCCWLNKLRTGKDKPEHTYMHIFVFLTYFKKSI